MRYLILIALTFIITLPNFSQVSNEKYDKMLDSLFKAGQKDEIVNFLLNEINKKPEKEKALLILGDFYISEEQFDLAEKYINEALNNNSKCAQCYILLGLMNIKNNNIEKAQELFDNAISISPNDNSAYISRATFKEQIGDIIGALFDYNKAIELDPNNYEQYAQRGLYNANQGLFALALSDLKKSIELKPDYAYAYFLMANIYFEKKMYNEALENNDIAIKLDSSQYFLYYGRGAIYALMNEFDKAISDYTKAIELNPNDHMNYYNRGLAQYSIANIDGYCSDMHEAYNILFKQAPEHPYAENINTSIKEICDSTNASYYYQRGIIFFNSQQFDKAIYFYNKGLNKFNNHPIILSFRGNAYLALNDYENALNDYYASIENTDNLFNELKQNSNLMINSKDSVDSYINHFVATTRLSIAESKFCSGKYDEALNEINIGLDCIENNLTSCLFELNKEYYYYLRGNIYMAKSKYDLAINDFKMSIKSRPDFYPAHVTMGVAKVFSNAKLKSEPEYVIDKTNSQILYVNWMLPKKVSIKNNDILNSALSDINNGVSIVNQYNLKSSVKIDMGYTYHIRGHVKYILKDNDYCTDIKNAYGYNYPIENSLFFNCID